MSVAIVTDSTIDWTLTACKEKRVVVVPLKVEMDGHSYIDQFELPAPMLYERLSTGSLPKTSQPAPYAFTTTYDGLADEGFDEIVSIHIAQPLSGTAQSARLGAGDSKADVHVVDSCNVSGSMGLIVLRACKLRDEGKSAAEIVEDLEAYIPTVQFYVALYTPDALLRGGRISEEQAQGIKLMNVKLIFTLDEEGSLANFDKAKGMKGVVKRFAEQAVKAAEEHGPIDVRIFHSNAPDEAEKLVKALDESGVDYRLTGTDLCGAIIGTHLGLGALGITFAPAGRH